MAWLLTRRSTTSSASCADARPSRQHWLFSVCCCCCCCPGYYLGVLDLNRHRGSSSAPCTVGRRCCPTLLLWLPVLSLFCLLIFNAKK